MLNKKLFIYCLSIFFITLLSACSRTKVSIPVMVPAKGISRLISPISITNFRSNSKRYGQYLTEKIKSGLSEEGYVKIKKSRKITNLSGNFNLGEMYKNTHSNSYTDKKGNTTYTHYMKKRIDGSVSYTLTDISGQMIASGNFTAKFDEEKTGSSSSEANANSATDDEIKQQIISKLSSQVVAAISPTEIMQQIKLENGSHSGFDHGITYMKKGRIEQAVYAWDQVVEQTTNSKEKASAYYNIGIAKEAQRKYKDAFVLFSKSDTLDPGKDIYIDALNRVENAQRGMNTIEQSLK